MRIETTPLTAQSPQKSTNSANRITALASQCLSMFRYTTSAGVVSAALHLGGVTSVALSLFITTIGLFADFKMNWHIKKPSRVHPLGWPDQDTRRFVKMATFETVCREFNLVQGPETDLFFKGKKQIEKLPQKLKLDQCYALSRKFTPSYILANPATMDFDEEWNRIRGGNTPFYIFHTKPFAYSALPHYTSNKLVDDYEQCCSELFNAARLLVKRSEDGYHHIAWYPLGTGKLLNDYFKTANITTGDEKLSIHRQLFQSVISILAQEPDIFLHFCFPSTETYKTLVNEAPELENFEPVINKDAALFAQDYTNKHGSFSCALVNGIKANRIGGSWFGANTESDMDENLHSRTSLGAAYALLWNQSSLSDKEEFGRWLENHLPKDNIC